MINILNLNPSIDYFLVCNDFELNKTNHSESESIVLGGKGSNVGMLLNNLEIDSIMHGFIGGFVGDYISQEMQKLHFVKNNMIDTGQLTRINVKLNFQGETEINGVGKIIPEKYLKRLENDLEKLESGDLLVMTGRVANGMSFDWYLKIAKQMHSRKVDFVLDTNDKILNDVLKYKPLLVKPNEDEIRSIFDHHGDLNQKDLINYGRQMLKKGAKYVIISMGAKGSLFFFEDRIYMSENLNREVKNTVGAGDSMIAGFLAEYQKSADPLKAYKTAQACGNASAFSEEIADKELIEEIYKHIKIKEIKNGN